MSKFKKTTFNDTWLLNSSFSPWLQRVETDKYSAYCTLCRTTFSLSNMGRTAVTSHLSGKKHKLALSSKCETKNIKGFFSIRDEASGSTSIAGTSTSALSESLKPPKISLPTLTVEPQISGSKNTGLNKFLQSEATLKSEVIWAIDTVMQHRSMRSSERSADLFKLMFPDSEIAKMFQLGRTKVGYLLVHGIAPYFKHNLNKMLNDSSYLVIGFDESLNKVSQKGQMDISVRFCDSNNKVQFRYFNSVFLGHSTADDLLVSFVKAIEELDYKKILQISMDGPNVNLKFLRLYQEYLNKKDNCKILLDIGSCGLHTVNNAFKAGIKATGWGVVEFLRALYNLFHHVPSRRAAYTYYTKSTTFPKKYCAIRWLENSNVAKTAQSILPNIIKYVEGVEKDKKEPKCQSFVTLKTMLKDKLLSVKLAFFQSLSEELEPFLRAFQSDEPLAPLLYDTLSITLKSLMSKVVKKDKLAEHTNSIIKIDVNKTENLKRCQEIDLGYGTRQALNKIGKCTDEEIFHLRKQCREAIVAICSKLQEKSPLKSKLTKGISVLNPEIALKDQLRETRMKFALETLVENNWLVGSSADKIHREFTELCSTLLVAEQLKSFDKKKQRLDELWLINVANSVSNLSDDMMNFLKIILTLSHGNASLERGFSINKECIIENQTEESLIAQRVIFDSVLSADGLKNLEISKSMLQYAKNSRSRYHEELERRRREKTNEEESRKRQAEASKEIKRLAAKKREILEETQRSLDEIEAKLTLLKK